MPTFPDDKVAVDEKPNATFFHRSTSPTAANAHDKKFGPSGKITYAVTIAGPMGLMAVEVEAYTGDEAAEEALKRFPGTKVARVAPPSTAV